MANMSTISTVSPVDTAPRSPSLQAAGHNTNLVVVHARKPSRYSEGAEHALAAVPAASESPRAVARNVLDCVQQATEARRDRELSQTMACLQTTVQMTQKSFQPLVETNNALCKQLAQTESVQRQAMMVLQAEVETLKEQVALQKQQLQATQQKLATTEQQLVKTTNQSKKIAAAATLAQAEAERKAVAAAREHAASIKVLIETSQAQMQALVDANQEALSSLQDRVTQVETNQTHLETVVDAQNGTISELKSQLNTAKQTTKAAVDRIAQTESGLQGLAGTVNNNMQQVRGWIARVA